MSLIVILRCTNNNTGWQPWYWKLMKFWYNGIVAKYYVDEKNWRCLLSIYCEIKIKAFLFYIVNSEINCFITYSVTALSVILTNYLYFLSRSHFRLLWFWFLRGNIKQQSNQAMSSDLDFSSNTFSLRFEL